MIEFVIIVVFVVLGVGLSHLPPIKRLSETLADSAKKASFEYSVRSDPSPAEKT